MELNNQEIEEYCKHMRIIQESIGRRAKIVDAELQARLQATEDTGIFSLDEFYLYPTIHNCQIALLTTAQELLGIEPEPGQDQIRRANDEIRAVGNIVKVLSSESSQKPN